jgi:predicted nucleic acid-binding protein
MKEIFEKLPHVKIGEESGRFILLDTCFFIHTFEHQKEHQLKDMVAANNVGMTSFNVEEFLFKEHVVDERVREYARKFLKVHPITIIDIDVHPGNVIQEREFVKSADSELLMEVPDASDAVLIAAAIRMSSIVLTKDKHHLFTTKLENYLQRYDIQVHKEFHDIQ